MKAASTCLPSYHVGRIAIGALLLLTVVGGVSQGARNEAAATSSSPIALTSDDRFVWVVNPDNNSVSVIRVKNEEKAKTEEIAVGQSPRYLAITADNKKVYVTNSRDGTVSVIQASKRRVSKTV